MSVHARTAIRRLRRTCGELDDAQCRLFEIQTAIALTPKAHGTARPQIDELEAMLARGTDELEAMFARGGAPQR
jgi:hypothetical protein